MLSLGLVWLLQEVQLWLVPIILEIRIFRLLEKDLPQVDFATKFFFLSFFLGHVLMEWC